jgi:hypothetical protein
MKTHTRRAHNGGTVAHYIYISVKVGGIVCMVFVSDASLVSPCGKYISAIAATENVYGMELY